ncbi:MAG TPA: ribonuclease H [Fibrobacter sp.]|nr:ribonuclease H [Fibrobacter sp.]
MAKMKYYAIKSPKIKKIVTIWGECLALTRGVKGVLFKSFTNLKEAENWLEGVSQVAPQGLRVYVDGSFSPDFAYSGWGFVVVENDKEIDRGGGITEFPAESRNIDGELAASIKGLEWLKQNQRTGTICHDYEGIARWAKGEWKAKSPVALKYIEEVKPLLGKNSFEKVEAHSGHKWNELVDKLAKEAIQKAKKEKLGSALSDGSTGQMLLGI